MVYFLIEFYLIYGSIIRVLTFSVTLWKSMCDPIDIGFSVYYGS